jgi:YfiH family protein
MESELQAQAAPSSLDKPELSDETRALRSPLLEKAGFSHAFFTRLGGVSRPPWDTLNFAAGVGDDPEAVAENLRRAAGDLGIDPRRLYFLSQVHGTAWQALSGEEDRDEVVRRVGDITISRAATPSSVGCGIRTADCVPVLLADRRSGAVAAVHSGWRGTVDKVAAVGVRALLTLLREPPELVAAIGPHIERCCFEVGEDVAASLARASKLGDAAVIRREGEARPRVDLRAVVRAQLEEAGVASSQIDDVPGCTVCDARRFHSYRRDRDKSGRLLSAIVAGTSVTTSVNASARDGAAASQA